MIMTWDDQFERGEYKDLTVLEVFQDNPFYLWFLYSHKGAQFSVDVQAALETRIRIAELFEYADEEDNGQGALDLVETSSPGSLGEQVRDLWQSEPEPDRMSSYDTSGEEVDTLGLEERDTPVW